MPVATVATSCSYNESFIKSTSQNINKSNILLLLLLLLNKNAVASSSRFVATECSYCSYKFYDGGPKNERFGA